MPNLLAAPLLVALALASANGAIIRGPYLQSGSSTGIVVRWRTDIPTDSVLRFGSNATALPTGVTNVASTTNHELQAVGLVPDTKYFYSIGSTAGLLVSGTNYSFRSSPETARPIRVWVIGDGGSADTNAARVRDTYQYLTRGTATDLWLMLGDNAYGSGTDEEYQLAVFNMYPSILRQTLLFPALGNHEAADTFPVLEPPPYLDIFTLPTQGECGGLPSGTELYYSFDYGNIHFICLDSHISERSSTGPMATWLRNDLAATAKDWIVAYWHHPPYTHGTHDSDFEDQLIEMRENIVPLLEDYGVDLVLTGHSHVYERSYLLDRHYGYSWEFNQTNIIARGSAFKKPSGGIGAHQGVVYAVCGCSGTGGLTDFRLHPAMAINRGGYGSMVLDFDGLVMSAVFITSDYEFEDSFVIDKRGPTMMRPALQVARAESAAVLSWPTSNPSFALEFTDWLSGLDWKPAGQAPLRQGRSNFVAIPMSQGAGFFRLRAAQ